MKATTTPSINDDTFFAKSIASFQARVADMRGQHLLNINPDIYLLLVYVATLEAAIGKAADWAVEAHCGSDRVADQALMVARVKGLRKALEAGGK